MKITKLVINTVTQPPNVNFDISVMINMLKVTRKAKAEKNKRPNQCGEALLLCFIQYTHRPKIEREKVKLKKTPQRASRTYSQAISMRLCF